LKILISHQKAKHFKCDRCGRRLNTAGGKQQSLQNKFANNANIQCRPFGSHEPSS
jgi:hypothetical protein